MIHFVKDLTSQSPVTLDDLESHVSTFFPGISKLKVKNKRDIWIKSTLRSLKRFIYFLITDQLNANSSTSALITTQDLLQGCQQTAAKISSEYELSGLEKT